MPEEIHDQLKNISIREDCENIFEQPEKIYVGKGKYIDNVIMTKEEIVEKLTELGFEYNQELEQECSELRYP